MQLMQLRRFLVRGESAVASTGLALAAILLVAMAGSTFWLMHSQRSALADAAGTQLQGLSSSLGGAAESLLEADQVTAVRRLIAQAALAHQLQSCRIVLGDGFVVADAEASRISHSALPDVWPRVPMDAALPEEGQQAIHREILRVPGRGEVILELAGSPPAIGSALFEAQAGVGAIGAVCLVLLLVVYRQLRRRFRGIGAVRDALLAMERGEHDPGALTVTERFGVEAKAWNRLISEWEQTQRQVGAQGLAKGEAPRSQTGTDLESVCDAMWQGLILVDDTMIIRYANGAAALLLQVAREQIVGAALDKAIADEHVLEPVRAVAAGRMRQRTSVELERDGDAGHTVLRFNVRPVRRGDKAAGMIIIEDITQQRVAEDARNSFVAQATHELRMPLTNIRLYVESAIEDGEGDPAVRAKCLNVINQESRRLERIVGDMLSVTEIEAGTMKLRRGDVRLDALFRELQIDYDAQAHEKNITLSFFLPPKLPVIQGDRDKLALTLHNLLGNALKYTPQSGKVTVTVDVTNSRLIVEIADSGLGINEDEQELIFQKFYRSKDQRVATIPGTGLGLALAREVMRLQGGDITVKSQINEGSTFTVSVPVLAEAA